MIIGDLELCQPDAVGDLVVRHRPEPAIAAVPEV